MHGDAALPCVSASLPWEELLPHLEQQELLLLLDDSGAPLGALRRADTFLYLLSSANRAVSTLETLLRTSSESICAIDEEGIVTIWNPQAEQRYKIACRDIIGQNVQNFFSNLLITKVQYNAMTSGKPLRDRYHQPLLGEHVLTNASTILQGESVLGAVTAERDISETMRLSHELARSNTQVSNLKREIDKYSRGADAFDSISGQSSALLDVVDMARRISNTDVSILLRGESGTGKELFAEAIHRSGKRREKPFVVINCGAIPQNLFESELFGYQPGAFTGADRRGRKGKFDEANQGTLFLDEIAELPLDMQVKLLRVLQDQRFYRVGGGEAIKVDVRLLSATNQDLNRMIEEGRFREDLYYRINVVTLELPPLRERKEDIPLLSHQFLREFCLKQGIPVKHLEAEVLTYLMNYFWPGNIRELRNVIERLVVLSEGNSIGIQHLPGQIKYGSGDYASAGSGLPEGGLQGAADKAEKEMILQALDHCQGDRSRAARFLGIPRSTLYYKMNKYALVKKKQ
ncbi:MAG: sigma 54-interacting transcriptional regulator [Bacillota bacterium]|nr:sigma 54-interacting transcriptional regulator [Bacillota bacterium]